jgi:GDP-4-dehydro-6-deoxy-D-mannose reductase
LQSIGRGQPSRLAGAADPSKVLLLSMSDMNNADVRHAFITGITGFAGSHLAELCLAKGLEVSGLSRGAAAPPPNLRKVEGRVTLYAGDIADEARVSAVLSEAKPDLVFHLAAETVFAAPARAMFEANILGTLNLLTTAADLARPPTVMVASSSAVYGRTDDPFRAIGEAASFNPESSYGLSKAAQDALALRLGARFGLPVVVARAFNHTGPRERSDFVASAVARQIAAAEAGSGPPRVMVGRLDTQRDFSDVRDIAAGYYLAATSGRAGEAYNLAAGRAVAIQTLVERLVSLSSAEIEIVPDESRQRPSDIPCQIGDAAKARGELGWTPAISLDTSLADLLDHWRAAFASTDRTHGF